MILNYRFSASVMVVFLLYGMSVFAGEGVLFSGPGALNSDPCPAADHIDQLKFNKKILYIPDSEDQVRDLLGKISSSNQDEATSAIVSLALAGNLEAFTKLLDAQNANGLSLYCAYYQNADEKKCIDPVLETAVIEYLDDPKSGEALLQLFRKNYYQSRVLFEKLINMDIGVGMDFQGSFNWMLEILLAFDKPEYLLETRKKGDRFYLEKRLEDEIYMPASKRLNSLIGNESFVYAALRKQKEEEERERKRQLAIQERKAYTATYNELIAGNLSAEGIKKNVAQLSSDGFAAKRAAGWLVIAGPDALPYMHAALLDTTSTVKLKYKLISMLGVIGDQSSIQPVLKTLQANPDLVHKDVLLSLSHMPVTDEAFSFVEKQLINSNSNKMKQGALVYFAHEKESRARKWIDQYSDTRDPELRLTVLYLAARLHDQRAKDSIMQDGKRGTSIKLKRCIKIQGDIFMTTVFLIT